MTEYDVFLQAIIENPSDDTPRLIFADWLEEHGEAERAEFIRIQCALANGPDMLRCSAITQIKPVLKATMDWRSKDPPIGERVSICVLDGAALGGPRWVYSSGIVEKISVEANRNMTISKTLVLRDPSVPELWPLHQREQELQHKQHIRSIMLDRVPLRYEAIFRRGFIAEITCTCADWLQHGPALVRMTPLEKVMLSDKKPRSWETGYGYFGLPGEISFHLAGGIFGSVPTANISRETAIQALSDACLAWARSQSPITA